MLVGGDNMRFFALVALAALSACNASVTVLDERDEEPISLPDDDPPSAPSAQCSDNRAHLTVELEGSARSCRFGQGFSAVVESVEPLGSAGVRMVTNSGYPPSPAYRCTIDVHGIDPRIAEALAPLVPNAMISGGIAPDRIDLYLPVACDLCVGCPCPAPLPVLFAAEASVDEPVVSITKTAVVERAADVCSDATAGCTSAAYRVRATVHAIDLGAPTAPRVLARGEAQESETIELVGLASRLHVARASGRSPGCAGSEPSLELGTAVLGALRRVRVRAVKS